MGDQVEATENARGLAARRRVIETRCGSCGRTIRGTRRRRYCSDVCRVRAMRRRQRAERHQALSLALTALPEDKLPIGERIERLIAREQLDDRERPILEERLVAVTAELLALLQATRRPS